MPKGKGVKMSYYRVKELILDGLAILNDVYTGNHINRNLSDEEVMDLYNDFHNDKAEVQAFHFRVRKNHRHHDEKDVYNKKRYLKKVSDFLIDAELRLDRKGLLDY